MKSTETSTKTSNSTIVHRFDRWSGRALPSPGEGNKVRGEGTGRARLEGGGHREGKA